MAPAPDQQRFQPAFFVVLVSTWLVLAVMPHVVQFKRTGGLGVATYPPFFGWLLVLTTVGFMFLDAVVTAHPLLCPGRAFLIMVNWALADGVLIEHDPLMVLFSVPLVVMGTLGSLVVSVVAMVLRRRM